MDAAATSPLPTRFRDVVAIGSGAQGKTYRAFDTELDREVAVKVLRLNDVADWKAFDRFERECAVLGSLEHPGVPRYLAHFSDEASGAYLLVMELALGRSLAQDIAEQRRRTEAQLVAITRQLLEVLVYLHELHPRVVHRDIKPGNVIQRADGRVVLVDFGGVAHPAPGKGSSTMIGTFGYMAPEQLYGKAGPRTDLYALGATIAALAAGVEGEDLPRRGHAIVLDEVFSAGPLRATLEAMLEVDPEARPASARQALRILDGEVPTRSEDDPGTAIATREATGLAPVTQREKRIVSSSVVAAVALSVMTRSPLLLLLAMGALIAYFAITRARAE